MGPLEYGLIGSSLAAVILFLLWRLERSKRLREEDKRVQLETALEAVRAVIKLERKMRGMTKQRRRKIEGEIEEIEKSALEQPKGEILRDIFGAKPDDTRVQDL